MKARVRARFGVTLEEEVVFLGPRPASAGPPGGVQAPQVG